MLFRVQEPLSELVSGAGNALFSPLRLNHEVASNDWAGRVSGADEFDWVADHLGGRHEGPSRNQRPYIGIDDRTFHK